MKEEEEGGRNWVEAQAEMGGCYLIISPGRCRPISLQH